MQAHAEPSTQNRGDLTMSIFSFFSRRKAPEADLAPDNSGLEPSEITQPLRPEDKRHAKSDALLAGHVTHRKSERQWRRELLYGVVRDTMARAGVLAASYKFKVLSLDSLGRQYLIMMDLVNGSAGEANRLAEIEAVLAQAAKLRHDILVTAVYWRVSEQVTAGLSAPPSQRAEPAGDGMPAPVRPRLAVAPPPGYEPLQQDEILAFKRAIAGATPPVATAVAGKVVISERRNLNPQPEFEDTQISPAAERPSPLSVTQYGDLH